MDHRKKVPGSNQLFSVPCSAVFFCQEKESFFSGDCKIILLSGGIVPLSNVRE